MKYERGIAAPPDMNKRQEDEFGFGSNFFGLTPPPSVNGDAPVQGGFGDFTFLFSRQGAGTVKNEVKSVWPKTMSSSRRV